MSPMLYCRVRLRFGPQDTWTMSLQKLSVNKQGLSNSSIFNRVNLVPLRGQADDVNILHVISLN